MYKRVVLKLSGEGLASGSDGHFNETTIDRLTDEISQVMAAGVQVAIVVGGGNFWRGRDARPDMDKVKAHQIGMIGTVMNGIYLAEAFRLKGVRAVVMTPFDFNGFTQRFTKEAALAAMADSEAVIFAGGTGHPFFSTDSIVALRACELEADAVLYGKTVNSVYTGDPKKNPEAKRYKKVSYATVMGKNLDVADISAISLTRQQNITSLIFALDMPGGILAACGNNDEIYAKLGGTKVSNDDEEEYYV